MINNKYIFFLICSFTSFAGCCKCNKNEENSCNSDTSNNKDKTNTEDNKTNTEENIANTEENIIEIEKLKKLSNFNGDIYEYNRYIYNHTKNLCENNEFVKTNIKKSIDLQSYIPENGTKMKVNGVETEIKSTFNIKGETQIKFEDMTTIQAALHYLKKTKYKKKIAILNFANWTNPGGGVTGGAKEQEESICRSSTLYENLLADNVQEFYKLHLNVKKNYNSCEYNDDIIYTPNVLILKDDSNSTDIKNIDLNNEFNKKNIVSVITCAAPNNSNKNFTDNNIYNIHISRASRIIQIALNDNVDIIILGAFGCGAFENNPVFVSKAYKEILVDDNIKNCFEKVIFAIPNKNSRNYKEFLNTFDKN